ncbi:alpha/beta fold hydrolase [Segniliparus rugosus]|uniref:Alpha/beta hydrolase n=1 Tax=Segniliparus rugosus (strain ATCC BAA-974 / DSM 45345 / CCUG 50838 / CIP 108380 / JCM 13579 / CDC 945) TaxID=679197 RepID=U1M252_SEGRC|nr:hypothetical protein [Segniliparus rugosus]ERG69160.1 hypothetical protein HMPREF9336_04304 [Segniliparus rugosus ATCC BAA-974]
MSLSHPQSTVAVGLPGAGADAELMREIFGPAAEAEGIALIAVDPDPGAVRESYLAALDQASRGADRVLVCGLSFGAHVGAHWASAHQDQCLGVLACWPAWLGDPAGAPAAQNARETAALLREQGLAPLLDAMRAGGPGWVAERLARSWTAQWPKLPEAFEEIGRTALPTEDDLRSLRLPVALGAMSEDPFHPVAVARQWAALLPHAELVALPFAAVGEDPARLGHATFEALGRLRAKTATG